MSVSLQMSMVELLNADSLRVLQPKHLKVPLYPHQLASIYKLIDCFDGYYDEVMKTYMYVTKFQLSNKEGSGKSFIIMGMIDTNILGKLNISKVVSDNRVEKSSVISFRFIPSYVNELPRCILVLNSLMSTWKEYIKQSTLNYFIMETDEDIEKVRSSDRYSIKYVLTTDMAIKKLEEKVTFSILFVDEADSIAKNISSHLFSHYTVLVSSNKDEMHKQFEVPSEFIVDCEKQFITKSVNYCKLNELEINCAMSYLYNIINGFVPDEAREYLVVDDFVSFCKIMNAEYNTEEEIIRKILKDLEQKIEICTLKVKHAIELNSSSLQHEEQRKKYQESLDNLKKRIESQKTCCVCCEEYKPGDNKLIMKCCKNSVSAACFVEVKLRTNCCPFCRHEFGESEGFYMVVNNMEDSKKLIIKKEQPPQPEENIMTVEEIKEYASKNRKYSVLKKIIHTLTCSGKRFLIFSRRSEDSGYLNFEEYGIKKMGSDEDVNEKNVMDLRNKKLNGLVLNIETHGMGLNFEYVDDIIFLCKYSPEKKSQAISRANRCGRKANHELNIWILTDGSE